MRRRNLRILSGITGLCLVAIVFLAGPVAARERARHGDVLVAHLVGSAESPGDPNGSGRAVVTLKPGSQTVCYRLSWSGIGVVTAAHIHVGAAGVAGPIVVPFFNAQSMPDTISGVEGCVHGVDAGLIAKIHDTPSDYYVNVHTTDFPTGAIRDQLQHKGKGNGHGSNT